MYCSSPDPSAGRTQLAGRMGGATQSRTEGEAPKAKQQPRLTTKEREESGAEMNGSREQLHSILPKRPPHMCPPIGANWFGLHSRFICVAVCFWMRCDQGGAARMSYGWFSVVGLNVLHQSTRERFPNSQLLERMKAHRL